MRYVEKCQQWRTYLDIRLMRAYGELHPRWSIPSTSYAMYRRWQSFGNLTELVAILTDKLLEMTRRLAAMPLKKGRASTGWAEPFVSGTTACRGGYLNQFRANRICLSSWTAPGKNTDIRPAFGRMVIRRTDGYATGQGPGWQSCWRAGCLLYWREQLYQDDRSKIWRARRGDL